MIPARVRAARTIVGPARDAPGVHFTDDDFGSAGMAACRILDPTLLPTKRLGDNPLAPVHG